MAEVGSHFSFLPRAVRKHKVEEATLFAGGLAFEQRLRIPGEFENPHALVHEGLLGFLMPLNVPETAALLLAPLPGHLVEEVPTDLAVELVDVHGVDPALETVVLCTQPLDRLLVLVAFVRMAGVQRLAHPLQNLVVEPKLAEHGGELLFQNLLAHIFATAGGGLAPAFIRVTGAVVVDVLLLLDLADHRAAAAPTGDQPGEGEVVGHAPMLAGVSAIQDTLHPLPQLVRHQRLMPSPVEFAIPLERAGVETVPQYRLQGARRNGIAAARIDEAVGTNGLREFTKCESAGDIHPEKLADKRGGFRVDRDYLAPIRTGDVAIAQRRLGWPDALLRLFLLALSGLLGQVVDVVLRHQHLDAVHELFRRPRLARQHHAFLREVNLGIEFVDRHPILEVAIKPVGLFNEDHPHVWMRLQPGDHLAESAATGLLGGFHIHIFLRDGEPLGGGVVFEQLQLGRDRVALLLLLLGRHTGTDHGARARRWGGGLGC